MVPSLQPIEVIHACQSPRDLAPVLDAQVTAQIQPYVLPLRRDTNQKFSPSLFRAWSEVRQWRKQLGEFSGGAIIHAHSFSAGMAAVRGNSPVVYDLHAFIDKSSAAHSWMARSFHAAEQFVFAHSRAIIVHTPEMRTSCVARGVTLDKIFVIPDPVLVASGGYAWNGGPESIGKTYFLVYESVLAQAHSDQGDLPRNMVPIAAN